MAGLNAGQIRSDDSRALGERGMSDGYRGGTAFWWLRHRDSDVCTAGTQDQQPEYSNPLAPHGADYMVLHNSRTLNPESPPSARWPFIQNLYIYDSILMSFPLLVTQWVATGERQNERQGFGYVSET